MQHALCFTTEVRDLPPVDGWRVIEPTGRSRATCTCGLNTGLVPSTEALRTAQDHRTGT